MAEPTKDSDETHSDSQQYETPLVPQCDTESEDDQQLRPHKWLKDLLCEAEPQCSCVLKPHMHRESTSLESICIKSSRLFREHARNHGGHQGDGNQEQTGGVCGTRCNHQKSRMLHACFDETDSFIDCHSLESRLTGISELPLDQSNSTTLYIYIINKSFQG